MTELKATRTSAVFITFSGNCRKALTFYHTCFGGQLLIDTFGTELEGYTEMPVVNGSLVAEGITIHGSDLVHNEGRKLGNYISIFLQCENTRQRQALVERLEPDGRRNALASSDAEQKLIEITDAFDVRWILSV